MAKNYFTILGIGGKAGVSDQLSPVVADLLNRLSVNYKGWSSCFGEEWSK